HLKIRYKTDIDNSSELFQMPVYKSEMLADIDATSDRFRFSAAVAAFGEQLRGGIWQKDFDFDSILQLARTSRGDDPFGYRGEFLGLVNLAKSLSSSLHASN
ncbi:MAG: Ca-activated chloride channel family protein, partial [Parasphingorhabdus sp.]